jgi:hypothetical protein
MTKIIGIQKPWCVTVRKKIGKPSLANYGTTIFGEGFYGGEAGDGDKDFYGVYQMRKCKEGRVIVRMKFYKKNNPQTEAQQANRQKFADAELAWQNLTTEQKKVYNDRAVGKPLHGFNIFISEYMLSH